VAGRRLIIRDAFYGVRRFGDFATQLGIPRASLTSRLRFLVAEGVLDRTEDAAGSVEYRLTAKGSDPDPVSQAMNTPRLLLEPIITTGVRG
jgi:DNA-binding HxlR family transcriptional regulator